MEDAYQSPLVSSSADGPPRPEPPFKYQFVKEPEEEDEDEDEEDEDEDEDLEELEVLERKPAGGLSAAPVPAAPAAGAPLLDFGRDFVPPAPRGPLPAAPPAASERQPSWDPSPAPSASPAPSLPAAAAPSKLPEDDEPPSRPPPPPPVGVSPQAEPAWTPPAPAPAPAAPPSTPAAPKRKGSSGSVEKIMDLKEQPGNTVSTGQEDFPSVLLETAASLPSLSPFSAASFKEQEYLGNLSAVLPTKGAHQETSNEAFKVFSEKAKNPFVDKGVTEFSELEYSEMGSSFSGSQKVEPAMIADLREEKIVKGKEEEDDDLVSNNILHNQQALPIAPTKSFKEEDKIVSPEKTKDSFNIKGTATEAPLREEYADFKPFEQVWEIKETYKEDSDVLAAGGKIEDKLESKMDEKSFAGSLEQVSHGKDSESSNDDTSFPSTPEALKDGSGAYITCAPFNPAATERVSTNIFPLLEDRTSENKTDEKKIEEKKAQIITENTSTKTSNPFLVATQNAETTDYVTTDNSSKVTGEVVANMPEGLTPDLVQEACESELNEVTGTKIAFETKMDLVQTSETVQESLYPVAQLCPSFEESEATPSPVLPDIVMEAPLNSIVPSAGASAVQPSSSPLEAPPVVNYENMKLEPENPPPYEEAMNVPPKNVSGIIKEGTEELEDTNIGAQETETPYISIACDLIKETKLSTEPMPDFSNYSEIAKVAQPVPDHSELVEDSSPDSEPVDLFSDDSISDVPPKQDEAVILVKENLIETLSESMSKQENKEKFSASPLPEVGKPYLESFQPNLETTKGTLSSDEVLALTQKEKIPLQMEELNTAIYLNDGLFISKEAKIRENETFSDSSPIEIIDEFPTFVSSKTDFSPQIVREYNDLEVSHKSEIANVQDGAKSLSCSELPHTLSSKNVQPKEEDEVCVSDEFSKDRPDISKVPLLPPNVPAFPTQTEIGSVVKPEVLLKEAEKKLPTDKEKEKGSPSALFSAELSKTSVVDLLYWRDIKKTGVVFGASLFLLLSLTVFSIVSVTAYIALALLSVTISFRIYKGVIQAIQKSDEGHPFRIQAKIPGLKRKAE
ncbi:Reticulon-4 [Galemys pyrenaicus]|uniref:Reticulon n=1 Tax=Galemys pyrenaicus TaxID=202257 RepID=A0A8J6A599_GALPY|nr:Reticulon-4 [Galemys pyrenaicus]